MTVKLVALLLSVVLQGSAPGQQASPPAASDAKKALAEGAEFLKANDNQRALAAFERAIALEPNSGTAHLQRCRVLAGLRRHEEAISACTESLRLNPGVPEALRDRGHYYLNLGRVELGLADLREAESLKKDDRGIYYHLGMANYLKGDYAEAAKAFEGCLTNSSDDGLKVECEAWLYPSLRRSGREAEAARLLDALRITSLPGHPGNYLDRLLLFKGVKTEEEVAKTRTLEGALSEATVGYNIGLWHLLNGRRAQARECFQRAVASGYTVAWGYRASEAELRSLR
jgi:tetratricopeptide (TPR) repeat protein